MSFEKAMNKMKFDIRLLDYNLSQGYITPEDYKKFLAQLEDLSNMVEPLAEGPSDSSSDDNN